MEKVYEVVKNNNKKIEMTESEVSSMLLSAGFMSMFKRLKIGEEMYNHDLNSDFKRIK
jgi:hypothetical protein